MAIIVICYFYVIALLVSNKEAMVKNNYKHYSILFWALLNIIFELGQSLPDSRLNWMIDLLQTYFKQDVTGTEQLPGPTDIADKDEWTDIVRGNPYSTNGINKTILSPDGKQFFQATLALRI